MTIISKLYIKQHNGVSIRLTFPIHQIIFADGKRIFADGKRIFADGKRIFTDGKRIFTDGKRILENIDHLFNIYMGFFLKKPLILQIRIVSFFISKVIKYYKSPYPYKYKFSLCLSHLFNIYMSFFLKKTTYITNKNSIIFH